MATSQSTPEYYWKLMGPSRTSFLCQWAPIWKQKSTNDRSFFLLGFHTDSILKNTFKVSSKVFQSDVWKSFKYRVRVQSISGLILLSSTTFLLIIYQFVLVNLNQCSIWIALFWKKPYFFETIYICLISLIYQ